MFFDFCAYIEYLSIYINAPSTIRNKISSLRVHFMLMGKDCAQLNHIRVDRALEAVDRNKSHIPRIKQPLDPYVIDRILHHFGTAKIDIVIRLAVLILYYGALRQSELMPRCQSHWDPRVQPTRSDYTLSHQCLSILIKTGKNMQRNGQNRNLVLHRGNTTLSCPVATMEEVLAITPTIHPQQPLLMCPATRRALPSSIVLRRIHQALKDMGLPGLVPSTSLHSLRKAAATNAFSAGCTETSIRNYGGWASDAYKVYIRTNNRDVNQSLINSLSFTQ